MVKKDSFGRNYLKGKNVFGEGITGFSTRSRQIPKVQRPRWLLLLVCLFVFSLFGLARLFDLQIVRGSYFRSLSDGNRVRRIPIRAPRGEILDRNGQALARKLLRYSLRISCGKAD